MPSLLFLPPSNDSTKIYFIRSNILNMGLTRESMAFLSNGFFYCSKNRDKDTVYYILNLNEPPTYIDGRIRQSSLSFLMESRFDYFLSEYLNNLTHQTFIDELKIINEDRKEITPILSIIHQLFKYCRQFTNTALQEWLLTCLRKAIQTCQISEYRQWKNNNIWRLLDKLESSVHQLAPLNLGVKNILKDIFTDTVSLRSSSLKAHQEKLANILSKTNRESRNTELNTLAMSIEY